MGLIVRELTRKKIFAVFVGVFIAGTPVLAFDLWLSGLVDRQGQEEVDTSAKRAISLAEFRVTQVVGTLDDLAKHGVNNCEPRNIEAIRQATFDAAPIKEIAVVGPDGNTLCTDLGLPLGNRKLAASEPLSGADGFRNRGACRILIFRRTHDLRPGSSGNRKDIPTRWRGQVVKSHRDARGLKHAAHNDRLALRTCRKHRRRSGDARRLRLTGE